MTDQTKEPLSIEQLVFKAADDLRDAMKPLMETTDPRVLVMALLIHAGGLSKRIIAEGKWSHKAVLREYCDSMQMALEPKPTEQPAEEKPRIAIAGAHVLKDLN